MQGRLSQSLHNAVRLILGIEQQNYRVQRPWAATVISPAQTGIPLDANTRVVELFDQPDLRQQLLILGEPGAGKTTMLLELAEDLLQRAIANENESIPVLIDLSSWKNLGQSFFEWLVSKLKEKYGRGFPAKQWLENNQLLPLLDGLDEVDSEHQQACAKALNAWLTGELSQRPCGVVVCCRKEEYEQIVRQPLNLYGAVYLRSLTQKQIANYFAQMGLQVVWHTVQQDENLQEVLTKPLFLSMFGLVQSQKMFSLENWQSLTTSNQRIEYLLSVYWKAVMNRELIIDPNEKQQGLLSKTYRKKQLPQYEVVQRALIFVAKALNQESQTELLIERMQPSWLVDTEQRTVYRSFSILFFSLLLIAASYLSGEFSEWLPIMISTFPLLKYVLTVDQISPIEKLQFNGKILPSTKEEYLLLSTTFRVMTLVFAGIIWLANKIDQGLSYFVFIILTCFVLNFSVAWVVENIRSEIIEEPIAANQGIKNTWNNMFYLTLIVFVLASLFGALYSFKISMLTHLEFQHQLFLAFIVYVIGLGFFEGGGKALIQHFSLRLVLAAYRYAPLRYDLLLNYCTERLLLQQVGGRYRFMHKLLQDYFARMDLD